MIFNEGGLYESLSYNKDFLTEDIVEKKKQKKDKGIKGTMGSETKATTKIDI